MSVNNQQIQESKKEGLLRIDKAKDLITKENPTLHEIDSAINYLVASISWVKAMKDDMEEANIQMFTPEQIDKDLGEKELV